VPIKEFGRNFSLNKGIMKKCTKCQETKELVKFVKNKNKQDGLNPVCKPCMKIYKIEWVEKNQDKIKEYDKIRNQTHKEFKRESTNKWKYKLQGIYKIYSDDLTLYVGQSKQLLNRISKHKKYINNPNDKWVNHGELYKHLNQYPDYNITIIEECSIEKLNEREEYWISQLKPLYNGYKTKFIRY